MISRIMVTVSTLVVVLFVLPLALMQDADEPTRIAAEAFRGVNVRSGPSTDYDIIARLEPGFTVDVIGRSDGGTNWLLIELDDGTEGWVAFFTVSVTGDPTQLPIASPNASQELATTNDLERVLEPARVAESDLYVTAYRRVNVRSGPGTEFRVLGVLVPGESADILGSSGLDHAWLRIRFGNTDGWVAYFVVNVTGDLSQLDVAEAAGSTEADNALAQLPAAPGLNGATGDLLVVTRFNVNLRQQPAFSASILGVVPYNTEVEVNGRSEDGNWLRVQYNALDGWLIASLVNAGVVDLEVLPVVSSDVEPISPG